MSYPAAGYLRENLLLAARPGADREPLLAFLRPVALSLGQVISESYQRINVAYFLTGAIVSLVYTAENGATAEMAMVGQRWDSWILRFPGGRVNVSGRVR